MADERDNARSDESSQINPRPSQVDTSPPQTDRSPAGPNDGRQIAQEPQQSTGLGMGQS